LKIQTINGGHTFTAAMIATTIKMQPHINGRKVKKVMVPRRLNSTLNKISESTSSTKAAVITACPKNVWSAPASCRSFRAMPTLVGAKDTPTASPSGKIG